jgi:hypothetical protein
MAPGYPTLADVKRFVRVHKTADDTMYILFHINIVIKLLLQLYSSLIFQIMIGINYSDLKIL